MDSYTYQYTLMGDRLPLIFSCDGRMMREKSNLFSISGQDAEHLDEVAITHIDDKASYDFIPDCEGNIPFYNPYLECEWYGALKQKSRPTPIHFRHMHGIYEMLQPCLWRGVDFHRRTQPAETESVAHSAAMFQKSHDVGKVADKDGYAASLDAKMANMALVPSRSCDSQRIPHRGGSSQQQPQSLTTSSIPPFSGPDASPLATHLIFYWCDGTRSNLVDALSQNKEFQRIGRLRLDITHSSRELKDQLLGRNVWSKCWDLWQANYKLWREATSYDGPETTPDDPSLTTSPDDHLALLPQHNWHYRSPEKFDFDQPAWHKKLADLPALLMFRRFVELNPTSEEAKGWQLASRKKRTRDRMTGDDPVRVEALNKALRLQKMLKKEKVGSNKRRRCH